MNRVIGFLALVAAAFIAAPVCMAEEAKSSLGQTIEDFSLSDFRGKEHALSDYSDAKAVVAIFLGPECPLAKLYGQRMQQLSAEFAPQGVQFLGINSNSQDSITELDAYARAHGVEFPILKDLGNKVADRFGAERTPQVFVLDQNRVIRYQGRIDGQYSFGTGVGYAQPKLDRRDLAEALGELLAGKEISQPVTEARGCLIGRVREANENAEVTYSNQIARLFQARCVECHREGQIAPFAMTSYDEVAGWGEMIAEVVRERRMPPWHADPRYGHFSNENRLSDADMELVNKWVQAGCPEGDPSQLPEPRKFAEGWMLPRDPDQVIYIADEAVSVKAEGVEDYRHYVVDPGFTEDKWVQLAECQPGNKQVVHHIIAFIKPPGSDFGEGEVDEDGSESRKDDQQAQSNDEAKKDEQAKSDEGQNRGEGRRARGRRNRGGDGEDNDISGFGFLAGFAPGTRPMVAPPGMAKKIPAGSKIVFQMHYTPCGTQQMDRSSIGLIFMDEKDVTHQIATTNASFHNLQIPPGDSNYTVDVEKKFLRDTMVLSLFPHMHIRGKSFKYELFYADGRHEVMLDVPQYDFNWQNHFILTEPMIIPKGTVMKCTASFDNSQDNLFNPDPSITVRWGPQTWEEMMIGWYDIAFPRKQVDELIKKTEPEAKADAPAEAGAGE